MTPNILLADDHSMIRKGVKLLCESEMGLSEVHEVASCKELLRTLAKKDFTHLVLDLNLSDGSSLDVLPEIRTSYPDLQIAVLTVSSDTIYYDLLKRSGIEYFINKTAQAEDTARLLGRFFRNEKLSRSKPGAGNQNPFSEITTREMQVLQHWLQGRGTKETASLMGITMSTVSTVKATILEKTKTLNFVQLNEMARLYKIV